MNRLTVILVLGLFLAVFPAAAQLSERTLETRIDDSALIVEATVVESTPFWNPDRTRILTTNRLRVHKVFKLSGRRLDEVAEIDLLTLGGRVDNDWHDVRPALSVDPGQSGVFFIEQRESFAGLSDVWLPVTGPQGFIRYDKLSGEARDPFKTFADVEADLFEPIRARTGQPYSVIGARPEPPPSRIQGGVPPTITNFSPNPVRGGIQQVLTINGSNFGSFSGNATIFFDDPDDGPANNLISISAFHVVDWTDSQIQVYVPDSAGTGTFVVQESTGQNSPSPSPLTVDYSLSEVISSGIYRLFQEDGDGRGGLTFRHSTSTANNGVAFNSIQGAVDRFEDALETWRCGVGWTAGVDGTTTVQNALDDGVNVVAFDNDADSLPAGVLGRATSYFTGCGNPFEFHIKEIDIRFRRNGTGVTWFYGSDTAQQMFGEHDFQSVAAHEVGHAVQHRHINDTGDMMFWSIANGANNRALTAANLAGGQEILSYSNGRVSACATGMRTYQCNTSPTARFTGSPLGVCGTSLAVDFTDLSYDGPTAWNWSFGDAGSSTQRNPSHMYTSAGVNRVSLEASNSSGMDTAENFVVLTTAPTTAVCDATFSGHNPAGNMGPTLVTLNYLDNSTASSQFDPLYDDFSCSHFAVLEPGMSYPITVNTGGTNPEVVRVYIDWDDNGTLAVSELVLDSAVGADTHNGTVNVPASPVLDTALRMRVLSDLAAAGVSGPCENIEFGQVEDYSVLVQSAAAAIPGRIPGDSLRVDKVGPTNVAMTWDPSCGAGAVDYSIYQGDLGNWTSHTQKVCSTSGNTFRTIGTGTPSRYFLVVPVSGSAEGSYGTDSDGLERPVGVSVCNGIAQDTTACP